LNAAFGSLPRRELDISGSAMIGNRLDPGGDSVMKHFIALAVGGLALTVATTAAASTVSQREYRRGYADCMAGRWDENQHGASYKEGCHAAEDKRDSGAGAARGDAQSGQGGAGGEVYETVVKKMLAACRARAARAYKASPDMVDTKYEGTRVDGTHPINGAIRIGDTEKTFQCNFDKTGRRLTRFIKN
jgi:hypothetical protein